MNYIIVLFFYTLERQFFKLLLATFLSNTYDVLCTVKVKACERVGLVMRFLTVISYEFMFIFHASGNFNPD